MVHVQTAHMLNIYQLADTTKLQNVSIACKVYGLKVSEVSKVSEVFGIVSIVRVLSEMLWA